jgi:ribonuclease D
VGKQHAVHLRNALLRTYELTTDWTIQKVTGSVLYYAIAVDPTALMPLNDIVTEHTKVTEKTEAATNQMLDYLAAHPDATIRYHASDMILNIHSDASYLSVSNARF